MDKQDSAQDRIIARVRKMMNLANDANATEGERDNALRMAHATLAKYNLDLAQVEAKAQGAPNGGTGDEPREQQAQAFMGYTWARTIAQATGKLFFCAYYYQKIRGNNAKVTHTFVGKRSNVVTAHLMAKYLVESVHREAVRYTESQGMNYASGGYALYRSFAIAAAHKIYLRCAMLRAEAENPRAAMSQAPGSTALVLASVYKTEEQANERFLAVAVPDLKVKKARTAVNLKGEALAAGAAYGAKVSLNQQLS